MRFSVQLALCALVGLAASPVALSLPMLGTSGSALYVRDPQGVAPDGPTSAASGPDGPTSAASGPDGPTSVASGPDGPTSAASAPDGPQTAASAPDDRVPRVARQLQGDGSVLLPLND